ncbi:MAG: nitroreductase family protein [Candidatus Sumerlaeota bacterium]|nr:nitroreductase family protein [Candidatus Sumerlaeota bacterium]
MDLFDAIAHRFSYRGPFLDQPVPREDLRRIVQAGLLAPSGCNEQTTTFVIVDDPALRQQIQAMHPKNVAMRQARAYIACLVDKAPIGVYEGLSFQVEDCSAAVENILLAATALGYATVWVDGWLRGDERGETIARLLGAPEGKTVRVILPLGRPADPNAPRQTKKPFEERAWFNRYGAAGSAKDGERKGPA